MSTNNQDPATGNAAPAPEGQAAPSAVLPAPSPVEAAINALPLETLQAERQRMAELRMDTSAFDRAIAAKGGQFPDPGRAKSFEHHGVSDAAKGSDYHPDFGELARRLTPERLVAVNRETGEWAAQMGFSKPVGEALIARIAEIGPRVG
jgi:hypothetical protein